MIRVATIVALLALVGVSAPALAFAPSPGALAALRSVAAPSTADRLAGAPETRAAAPAAEPNATALVHAADPDRASAHYSDRHSVDSRRQPIARGGSSTEAASSAFHSRSRPTEPRVRHAALALALRATAQGHGAANEPSSDPPASPRHREQRSVRLRL